MERLKVKTAVFMILEREGKILFLQRYNTGYYDGLYSLPSGHVEAGEFPLDTAVRELEEEVNVIVKKEDLQLVHMTFEKNIYIDFYFVAKSWENEPKIGEVDRCSDLKWIDLLKEKPDIIIEKVYNALSSYKKGILYSEFEEEELEKRIH